MSYKIFRRAWILRIYIIFGLSYSSFYFGRASYISAFTCMPGLWCGLSINIMSYKLVQSFQFRLPKKLTSFWKLGHGPGGGVHRYMWEWLSIIFMVIRSEFNVLFSFRAPNSVPDKTSCTRSDSWVLFIQVGDQRFNFKRSNLLSNDAARRRSSPSMRSKVRKTSVSGVWLGAFFSAQYLLTMELLRVNSLWDVTMFATLNNLICTIINLDCLI